MLRVISDPFAFRRTAVGTTLIRRRWRIHSVGSLWPFSGRLTRLKLLTIFAPLVFLTAVDFVRQVLYPSILNLWPGNLLVYGAVLVAMVLFSETVFRLVDRIEARLVLQNRELLALHEAGLDVAGALELEVVLQRIVERARDLVGARRGTLALLREGGGLEAFITSTAPNEAPSAEDPPADLVQDVIANGHPIRRTSSHATGQQALVAVPVLSSGPVLGMIQLTGKISSGEFDADDEGRLVRFATQAGLAIQNAQLHQQVRALAITAEREWIAREMHDNLAQVLGYVNTKAQAAQVLLGSRQPEQAAAQIGQLAEAARAAYADVREGILGLRVSRAADHSFGDMLRDYLDRWQEQCGVTAELVVAADDQVGVQLSAMAELQVVRIVQEALSNVRKHARATEAQVLLRRSPNAIEIAVEDNGIGFDPASLSRAGLPRFGLATMRERAEAIGGTLEIRSRLGKGTCISVCLPVAPATGTISHAVLV